MRDCMPINYIVQVPSHMVMSNMATNGALCSNIDMGENEGKKVQKLLVERKDSNGPCQD